jgi:hypothetical protein
MPDGGRIFEVTEEALTWIRIAHQTRYQFRTGA